MDQRAGEQEMHHPGTMDQPRTGEQEMHHPGTMDQPRAGEQEMRFEDLDRDMDDQISWSEFQQAFPEVEREMFDTYDVTNTGHLNQQEWQDARRDLQLRGYTLEQDPLQEQPMQDQRMDERDPAAPKQQPY
jgi:hypothetical protein